MSPDDRIERSDIEAKLRQLQGEVDTAGEAARGPAMIVAGVVAVVVLGMVFLFGKKRGRRQTTTVEIRRV